ncbi:NAD(P)-dependent dehydrogenase (short-subunit alcohol dehydrogenase family) [Thermosporothrix hazakensis]|uniref:NAD(P)-dependent dehydrogenase (Short-subunit alcohol dehydrogenase family) n=1 Tax=Thermosporothrix hazakensis TaxID=644383 RepID=A0A326UAE3_THEHA|nr:SDR family NAD(P)-dependent oxidoreductase [Thermosporothrix hazakensis]PZW31910.1 NAD(P)-dependent dehydrogenase (short-subunit alcohol dehydrogenase family) [Thermosporothrix hazakensis]GCE49765.1 3-oxoacyl-[acyl-carrier-protein] reductase FabG [Thermosporothrix hazakensis]
MSGRLADKVVLITGTGGQGTGRAAALLFAQEGARVVGCASSSEGGQETVRLVREAGGEMLSVDPVDLTEPDQVQQVIDRVESVYGRLDVLYNNAARLRNVPILEMSLEDWRFTLANELDSVFLMTRAAIPLLIRSGGGTIINTSSVSALKGTDILGFTAHAAAKAGVLGLTRQLAVELAPYNIRVNALVPGGIVNAKTAQWFLKNVAQKQPEGGRRLLKRIGKPEDYARVALFLASDEASYLDGTELLVDGGESISRGERPGGHVHGHRKGRSDV